MASARKTTKPAPADCDALYIPDSPPVATRELPPVQTPVPARPLPSMVPAARSIFRAANIEFDESTDPWTVVGRFLYWPLNGMWRSIDNEHRGYSAVELMRLIRRQAASPEAVAAVAAALDPIASPPTMDEVIDKSIQADAYHA